MVAGFLWLEFSVAVNKHLLDQSPKLLVNFEPENQKTNICFGILPDILKGKYFAFDSNVRVFMSDV